jgi:hypothetical protein
MSSSCSTPSPVAAETGDDLMKSRLVVLVIKGRSTFFFQVDLVEDGQASGFGSFSF